MPVAVSRTTRYETATNIMLTVYPEFTLGGGVIRLLVKGAMTQKKATARGFQTSGVR